MGWLWASPSPPKTPTPGQAPQAPAPTPPVSTKSTDSEVDDEIAKFIALFQNDSSNKPEEPAPQPAQTATAAPKSSPSSSWFSLKSSPDSPSQTSNRVITPPSDNPVAESNLPTEMSCRAAFDMAFHCQSVGGQWNHIYRYGTMRSCSEHWEDFWFCMRIKSYSGKMKEDVIRDHYRNKEYEKYGDGKPSSEDVWQSRTTKVPPGTTFTEKFDEPTLDDEEWQRMEIERRRQIRSGLGIETATA
ncbi:hypothetical protein EsH8_II_000106 [Colletotrichum jinshuiense]